MTTTITKVRPIMREQGLNKFYPQQMDFNPISNDMVLSGEEV